MYIYDTHAHLDQLENLDAALKAAAVENVKGIVAISMDLKSCHALLEIKKKYASPKVYIAMGMHPSEVNLDELPKIIEMIHLHHKELIAVGEIGMDFWYKWVKKDEAKQNEQRQVFRELLKVAKQYNLPAVIHSRGCWQECVDIVKQVGNTKALFHWYSGPLDVLDQIVNAGYYVSTSPSVDYSPQSRSAMVHAPMDRVLIETDCPVTYTDQDTQQSFKATPKDVWWTLKAYAQLKEMSPQQVLPILNQNAEKFFALT